MAFFDYKQMYLVKIQQNNHMKNGIFHGIILLSGTLDDRKE